TAKGCKVVRLAHNNLPDASCTRMASRISKNQKILDLSRNRLSDPDFRDLVDALSSPDCRIEELHLDRNDLQDTSCIQLASVIRNNPSLKKLVLSDNNLYGPHFIDLVDALSSPDCRIEELHLDRNDLPDTSCTQLAFGIRENQFLRKLVLSSNHLYGPHFIDLMDALGSPACRIEELHLDRNYLQDTSCTQLALGIRENQTLKRLDLSTNNLYGPHFSDLMDALSSPDCRIEELHLAENDLQDTSCTQLAFGMSDNQSLKILDLSYNNLSGPHLSDLMDALSSPACRIETLYLVENHLSDSSCTQLAFGVRDNQSLKKLVLSNNRLSGPHFSDLMDALSSPDCRIEELHLANTGLQDTSCVQLAFGIRENQTLRKLVLSNNHLSGPHFSDLMDALSSPDCRIEELHLANTGLQDTFCVQLAFGIRENQTLRKLVLSNNRLSGPHFSDLVDALSSPDCRIEELHLEYNELSENEKEALKELEIHKLNLRIIY
ncbi:ribonuclease inhibitor-like, partial [Hyla sarda]|uniref:ribonuclease inhibitor-like n=1 Tax=Hyla sarda TaxID=327740 RepID=UPI0024C32F7D